MPLLSQRGGQEFGDRRRPLRLAICEELFEVVDAEPREGDRGYVVVQIEDGEAAVFRLHAHGDLVEPIFILAEHFGDPANGEHVAWCSHGQAA
jgi:hypothetical protein